MDPAEEVVPGNVGDVNEPAGDGILTLIEDGCPEVKGDEIEPGLCPPGA